MKMKFTRQFDQMDCGPACIRMVASAYGQEYSLGHLRTLSHLTREGVSIAGIRDAMSQIGMQSASFEMTLDELYTKCPLPAILHWEQNHFVVLYDVSRKRLRKERIYKIANPAFGKQSLTEKDFAPHWLNGEKGIVIACEPTEDFYEKKVTKEHHSMIRFARKFVWPYRREMSQTALGMLFGIILSLITPFLTQAMVDEGIGQRNMGVITNLMLAQLFLFLGSFGMSLIGSWISLYIGTRINIDVLENYLNKLLHLPMSFFDTKSVGDYQQRLGDNGRLQSFVTFNTLQTFFMLLSAPVLMAVIGFYSWQILLAYLFFTISSMTWMAYFFKRRKALDYERFRLNVQNQNKMYELMSGITDIKVNAYEEYKLSEWRNMQEKVYAMSKKGLQLGQVQNTGFTMISQLRNIIITFWIATEVVNGNLTLGMMMSISNIIGQVNGPLSQLIGFLQQYQDAKISLERSEEVHLCKAEDHPDMMDIQTSSPLDIHISHLSFSYTGSIGKKALDNISFSIPSGKMTAIVGESGSGKTTLLKLLLKFYTPTEGTIIIGEHDLNKYNARSIRKVSGIVMQDNYIFSDSIRENIVLGEKYDETKLHEAVKAACLEEYIAGLPLGLDTKIGSEGIGVSGGERQRIMIARAIYKQPQYLMMDEATSSLDAENEKTITQNIGEICKGRTLLVIAHRLSTVRNADQIIVLRHGKIVERGTHHELIAHKGYYYELIKNQLELETS
ncbi:MAG: peptidase domain-containing ABC transporter [Bacteroides sp.]|nr:peptidase domain-containing ABC transporter [Roseburia sp.]MCM1345938.1 peptidase domain-containing ABC transporter [Bacteroides sp.]MCM1420302.1 peptidase domain-containing ABC transporter [Bacteroides sp.]